MSYHNPGQERRRANPPPFRRAAIDPKRYFHGFCHSCADACAFRCSECLELLDPPGDECAGCGPMYDGVEPPEDGVPHRMMIGACRFHARQFDAG